MSDVASNRELMPVFQASPDCMLQELVLFVNQNPLEIEITLSIPGAMVSGMLISKYQYYDKYTAQVADGFRKVDPELAQAFLNEVSKGPKLTPEDERNVPASEYNFIHLKDVKMYSAGVPEDSVKAQLWRGRISEVAGFFLGSGQVA
jgi:hypothetical protein